MSGAQPHASTVTPSAVSHGVGRLRILLNDPLFLRTPKGVVRPERALALREAGHGHPNPRAEHAEFGGAL